MLVKTLLKGLPLGSTLDWWQNSLTNSAVPGVELESESESRRMHLRYLDAELRPFRADESFWTHTQGVAAGLRAGCAFGAEARGQRPKRQRPVQTGVDRIGLWPEWRELKRVYRPRPRPSSSSSKTTMYGESRTRDEDEDEGRYFLNFAPFAFGLFHSGLRRPANLHPLFCSVKCSYHPCVCVHPLPHKCGTTN